MASQSQQPRLKAGQRFSPQLWRRLAAFLTLYMHTYSGDTYRSTCMNAMNTSIKKTFARDKVQRGEMSLCASAAHPDLYLNKSLREVVHVFTI